MDTCFGRIGDETGAGGEVRPQPEAVAGDRHGVARSLRERRWRQDLDEEPGCDILDPHGHGVPGPGAGYFMAQRPSVAACGNCNCTGGPRDWDDGGGPFRTALVERQSGLEPEGAQAFRFFLFLG